MIGRTQDSWLKLLAFVAVAGVFCAVSLPQSARAEEDRTAQIEKLFREGVDLYQQGKYSDSQHRFHDMLALDPRKELAARLVDEAGVRIMTKMMSDLRMGNDPTRVWQLYNQYKRQKLADKERMTKLVQRLVDPNTSDTERALLYRELGELGQYAVPYLAPYLKDATHEEYRTVARIAISRMGTRATLAVIALLNHKEVLMRENAVLVLADLQPLDPRAIPALKARLEDPKEEATVKGFADRTLQRITGLAPAAWKSASAYYYDMANRYYLDRPGVSEESEEIEGMLWHLNDAGELITVQYPLWAWNDQMAEDLALAGMGNAPDNNDFYPLWACIQGAQYSKVKDLMDIVNEQPSQNSFSAEEKKDIENWDKKMVDTHRLAAAVGKEYCNTALNKVHADIKRYPGHGRLPQVGVFLARELALLDPAGDLLQASADAAPGAPAAAAIPVAVVPPGGKQIVLDGQSVCLDASGKVVATASGAAGANGPAAAGGPAMPVVSSLVAGLESSEEAVQYACALALASINRFPAKWAGSERVGAILGRGVSENKALQVLLVEEKLDASNEMRSRLEKLGYGVSSAVSGRDALVQARSFPPKDIAIVSESLRRDLTPEQLLEEMRADLRTRYLPVGILHMRSDHTAMQARFSPDMPLVERESDGNDLKVASEAIAAKRATESVPKRKAHEIAVACATALANLDTSATYIGLDDAVQNATDALVNRPDDVRNPAAIFLGHSEGGTKKQPAAIKLRAVFEDTNNAVELRRNALRSLGRVQRDGVDDVYVKSQADPDQQIKDIGAEAFGQTSRPGKSISDLLHQERIDKEHKEK